MVQILLIHSRYSKFGGGENYVSSFGKLLEEKGNKVFLFSIDNTESWKNSKEFIFKDNFNINDPNLLRLLIYYLLRFYFHPVLTIKLRKWIQDIKPDVIHIHGNDRYGISVLLAVKDLGIPVVQTLHANDTLCLSRTFKKPDGTFCLHSFSSSCLSQKCMSFSKFFAMVPSYVIRNQLAKRIVDEFFTSNIFLVKRLEINGFKPVFHVPLFVWKNENPIPPESGNIFCPGTLLEEKGFQYLIRAMVYICRCYPCSILHIAGKGPYSEDLKKVTLELGLNNQVVFHGYLDHQELYHQYAKSSLVVFPSLFLEVSPLVILEAMSSGRPVVAGKNSGINELFSEEKIGCLVDPMEPEQIAKAVCSILNDPNLANLMGQNGRQLFERMFSPDVHYQNIITLYQSAVEKSVSDRIKG